MTKAINPHAVIPKLFASWQQEDVPAQPTQLSMFFHLYEADIGQYWIAWITNLVATIHLF